MSNDPLITEIQSLKAQMGALDQLLEVFENATTEQTDKLYAEIAERKRAEAQLSESEEKFRTIFDKASDGILLADAESKRFLMGNEAMSKMLGYSCEELRQLGVSDIHPLEDLPPTLEAFEKLVKAEIDLTAGRSVLRKDGSIFYADIRASSIKIGARTYLLGTFRDITERRQAEADMAFKNTILATQQECSLDGILVVDENANIISFNRRFVEMWGIPPELAEAGIDEPVLQFVATRPADPEGFLARVRHLYEQREEKSRDEITLKDGRILDRYSAPMTGANGKYYGRVWYFRDITEPKKVEKEIYRLNEELEQKVEQLVNAQEELLRKEKLSILGQLSGSIGHELRNPLGVMSNAVYFLKMVLTEADDTTKEYLDIITHEIDNSQRIISDLLDFARTRTPQIKTVTARQLLDGTIGKCVIPENVELHTDLPDTLPLLKIDTLQMVQVLQNLITNAVQAMPEGGTLRLAANSKLKTQNSKLDGDFVEISVSDSGEGISPESMNRLFQPLFTTKAKGIGLGLVVCRNLVEANGGKIEVESRLGEGTTFTVTLPTQEEIPS